MFSQLHPHPFNIDDPFTLCRKLYMGIQCRTSLHTWFPSCPKTLAAHSVHSLFGPFTIISLYVPLLLSGCSPWNKWKDDSQLDSQLTCEEYLQRRIRFGCHYQYFMTAVPFDTMWLKTHVRAGQGLKLHDIFSRQTKHRISCHFQPS